MEADAGLSAGVAALHAAANVSSLLQAARVAADGCLAAMRYHHTYHRVPVYAALLASLALWHLSLAPYLSGTTGAAAALAPPPSSMWRWTLLISVAVSSAWVVHTGQPASFHVYFGLPPLLMWLLGSRIASGLRQLAQLAQRARHDSRSVQRLLISLCVLELLVATFSARGALSLLWLLQCVPGLSLLSARPFWRPVCFCLALFPLLPTTYGFSP